MTAAADRSYYIDQYSDEVVPCDCSLDGWAKWLSEPALEWGREKAATDGDTFKASVLRWGDDVIATAQADGSWHLSGEPENAALVAVRFGPGAGWDVESIAGDFRDLHDILVDFGSPAGTIEHVAIGFTDADVMLTYRADPPRLIVSALS